MSENLSKGNSILLCSNNKELLRSDEFIRGVEFIISQRKKYNLEYYMGIFTKLGKFDGEKEITNDELCDLKILLADEYLEKLGNAYIDKLKKIRFSINGSFIELQNWANFFGKLNFGKIREELLKLLDDKNIKEKTNSEPVGTIDENLGNDDGLIARPGSNENNSNDDDKSLHEINFESFKENLICYAIARSNLLINKLSEGFFPVDFFNIKIKLSEQQKKSLKPISEGDIKIESIADIEVWDEKVCVIKYDVKGRKYVSVGIPEGLKKMYINQTVRGHCKGDLNGHKMFNDKFMDVKIGDIFKDGWMTLRIERLNIDTKNATDYFVNELVDSGMFHDSNFDMIVMSEIMCKYFGKTQIRLLVGILGGYSKFKDQENKLILEQTEMFGVAMNDYLFRPMPFLVNGEDNVSDKKICLSVNSIHN